MEQIEPSKLESIILDMMDDDNSFTINCKNRPVASMSLYQLASILTKQNDMYHINILTKRQNYNTTACIFTTIKLASKAFNRILYVVDSHKQKKYILNNLKQAIDFSDNHLEYNISGDTITFENTSAIKFTTKEGLQLVHGYTFNVLILDFNVWPDYNKMKEIEQNVLPVMVQNKGGLIINILTEDEIPGILV